MILPIRKIYNFYVYKKNAENPATSVRGRGLASCAAKPKTAPALFSKVIG